MGKLESMGITITSEDPEWMRMLEKIIEARPELFENIPIMNDGNYSKN
ncbi:MAG: hypothetical protein Q7R96_01330 [Nanoarchaeota archaeon]|nr:hypothetical protein [Nanoarchaeota archaeon]